MLAGTARRAEQQGGPKLWAFLPLSNVLVALIVTHKCACDALSRFTRVTGVPYSASTAAVLGEIVKIPVISLAVLVFEGPSRFMPTVREAITDKPFALALPGLAYSIQNILYFEALSHLSVPTYQILSQSKLLFTALFMCTLLQRRLSKMQVFSLVLLMAGTVFTQVSEMPRSSAIGGSALWGGFLALTGALLSALPNVYYEKVLKTKGRNQWTSNMQLTFWIWFWLIVITLPSLLGQAGTQAAGGSGMLTGITPWVWLVIWLQSLKCILIPAILKYGDNIVYSYAKPLSILLSAVVTTYVSGILPSKMFVLGGGLVLASIWLYGS